MNKMEFERVMSETIQNSGGTFSPKGMLGMNFDSGYQVALKGYEIITDLKNDIVKVILESYQREASNYNDMFIGLWLNQGKLYIDLSVRVEGLNKAMQLAKENNQLAIWDWDLNSERVVA